ncbi:hypothetical protein V6N12_043188 [Hibiscus sabdariffa]|uniref:Uncharacterized protein n=1 Tax=Hibiscus sabdariffa TaxID=183260 RepID=A0ABR2DEM2_9ROSI
MYRTVKSTDKAAVTFSDGSGEVDEDCLGTARNPSSSVKQKPSMGNVNGFSSSSNLWSNYSTEAVVDRVKYRFPKSKLGVQLRKIRLAE